MASRTRGAVSQGARAWMQLHKYRRRRNRRPDDGIGTSAQQPLIDRTAHSITTIHRGNTALQVSGTPLSTKSSQPDATGFFSVARSDGTNSEGPHWIHVPVSNLEKDRGVGSVDIDIVLQEAMYDPPELGLTNGSGISRTSSIDRRPGGYAIAYLGEQGLRSVEYQESLYKFSRMWMGCMEKSGYLNLSEPSGYMTCAKLTIENTPFSATLSEDDSTWAGTVTAGHFAISKLWIKNGCLLDDKRSARKQRYSMSRGEEDWGGWRMCCQARHEPAGCSVEREGKEKTTSIQKTAFRAHPWERERACPGHLKRT
ncbi:hypothetical protein EDD16DRAFT_1517047 [Pisolithus croceorrhizus]|nr:hypothetical protein EDD16DRAFT_1517047 [Pisolithus croceorrhizus]KAI6128522.1 hypothetical protein EV401DRAFT_1885136 [Pisolithus croceorrhizus]